MKKKTKTIRISKTLHGKIKRHIQPLGMRLEAWTEKVLQITLADQPKDNP